MSPPTSGPITVEMPKTPPMNPAYRPRSRGETTSPITACVLTISAPPPSPWMPRKMISSVMFWLSPHNAEPIRKITSAPWSTIFRPSVSPSFPAIGVVIVEVSR